MTVSPSVGVVVGVLCSGLSAGPKIDSSATAATAVVELMAQFDAVLSRLVRARPTGARCGDVKRTESMSMSRTTRRVSGYSWLGTTLLR